MAALAGFALQERLADGAPRALARPWRFLGEFWGLGLRVSVGSEVEKTTK